jgi:predicted nucleotide-binding protein (sugar kinase/HSP70/actin superfamily)
MREKELPGQMELCAEELAHVPLDRSHVKPIVGVVGEIYVRSHDFANDNLVRQLEALGVEVNLAGFNEWLYYTNLTRKWMARRWGDMKLFLQNWIKNRIQHKIEKRLAQPLELRFGSLVEGDVREVIDLATPYIHESFEGEAILSVGKQLEMYHHGASGTISVGPFTCMPSTIVGAISRQMSRDCGGLPILNIAYDGQQDPTLPTRLEAFVHQVRNFDRQRKSQPVPVH